MKLLLWAIICAGMDYIYCKRVVIKDLTISEGMPLIITFMRNIPCGALFVKQIHGEIKEEQDGDTLTLSPVEDVNQVHIFVDKDMVIMFEFVNVDGLIQMRGATGNHKVIKMMSPNLEVEDV